MTGIQVVTAISHTGLGIIMCGCLILKLDFLMLHFFLGIYIYLIAGRPGWFALSVPGQSCFLQTGEPNG